MASLLFYVLLQIDLTYKMRIGSTVTKKQYASPGGQPRNGVLHRREKNPGPVLSLTNEDSQKKMWGKGKTIQNTNRSLQNTNREEES